MLKKLDIERSKINLGEYHFAKIETEYLDHRVRAGVLKLMHNKIEAIQVCQSTGNLEKQRSFLGLVHHLGKFVRNL